jgi:hypothetical protein
MKIFYYTFLDFRLDGNFNRKSGNSIGNLNDNTLSKKVSEMEIKIKNLQSILDNKVNDYETQLKICEEKKSELLIIKERILKAQHL